MKYIEEPKSKKWRNKYNPYLGQPSSGEQPIKLLEDFPDDSILVNPVQVKGYDSRMVPQGGVGKIYYDKTNKAVKIYIDEIGKWGDFVITTTSTSTSSSTSSSTSTSTSSTTSTSSSTSTTSTSTTTS